MLRKINIENTEKQKLEVMDLQRTINTLKNGYIEEQKRKNQIVDMIHNI